MGLVVVIARPGSEFLFEDPEVQKEFQERAEKGDGVFPVLGHAIVFDTAKSFHLLLQVLEDLRREPRGHVVLPLSDGESHIPVFAFQCEEFAKHLKASGVTVSTCVPPPKKRRQ